LPQAREQRLAPVDLPPPSAVDRVGGEDALREERCRLEPGQNQALIRNLNCSPSTH
jgi:hypothetical protein